MYVLKNSKNIHQALITVGLTPKAKNYERAKKLYIKMLTLNTAVI